MRILLIDDEEVALNVLKKRVDWVQYGFSEVLTAQDARQAKLILARGHVDLVISDIEMPGEDGLALAQYINENYPATESVIVTCHADFNYIKKAMKTQVLDYILKPIDYDELKALLQQFADHRKLVDDQDRTNQILRGAPIVREAESGTNEDRIGRVKIYIENHLRDKLYIEELARLVHVNGQHLMRIFKKDTGMSLTQYINERRILMAGHLLKHSDYPINYIADLISFENMSYFTRLFKKYTGFTPSEYRSQFGNRI